MDPAELVDWEAEAFCDVCDKDTDHYFSAPYGARGRWAVTHLTCEACGRETELGPTKGGECNMTSREYCNLSDLEVSQCAHCSYAMRTLGPIEFDDWIEDED